MLGGGGSRGGVQASVRAVAGSYGGGIYKVAGAVVVLVVVLVSGPAGTLHGGAIHCDG